MNNVQMCMITNAIKYAAGCFTIAVACKVTKSAMPLLALILVPFGQTACNSETTIDEEPEKEEETEISDE